MNWILQLDNEQRNNGHLQFNNVSEKYFLYSSFENVNICSQKQVKYITQNNIVILFVYISQVLYLDLVLKMKGSEWGAWHLGGMVLLTVDDRDSSGH